MVDRNRSTTDGSNIDAAGESKALVPDYAERKKDQPAFTVIDATADPDNPATSVFIPSFFPENARLRRQRELDRQRGFCGGENVSDTGAKNAEIHVQGKLLGEVEKEQLQRVTGLGTKVEIVSTTWSGEAYVKEMEIEGPVGWHPPRSEFMFEYTLDFVSTGIDDIGQTRMYTPRDTNGD